MKYLLLEHISPEDLSHEVGDFLAQEWIPYGSPFAHRRPHNYSPNVFYCQAIVRYEPGDLKVVGPYDV